MDFACCNGPIAYHEIIIILKPVDYSNINFIQYNSEDAKFRSTRIKFIIRKENLKSNNNKSNVRAFSNKIDFVQLHIQIIQFLIISLM